MRYMLRCLWWRDYRWLARLRWPCYIGWHAQRMQRLGEHVVIGCPCCERFHRYLTNAE